MDTTQEIVAFVASVLAAVVVRVVDHYWPGLVARVADADNKKRDPG